MTVQVGSVRTCPINYVIRNFVVRAPFAKRRANPTKTPLTPLTPYYFPQHYFQPYHVSVPRYELLCTVIDFVNGQLANNAFATHFCDLDVQKKERTIIICC